MHTVLFTDPFLRDAKAAGLDDEELMNIASIIAADPTAGKLVRGTGGARKLRFPRRGGGKSDGYRTVHYFGGEDVPVFMIALVDKASREDLTQTQRNELADVLPRIADACRASVAERTRKGRRR